MPIYEYECEACAHRFENLQEMKAPAPACPKCKGKVRKLLSASTPLTGKGGRGKAGCGMEDRCGSQGGGCCGGKCGGH